MATVEAGRAITLDMLRERPAFPLTEANLDTLQIAGCHLDNNLSLDQLFYHLRKKGKKDYRADIGLPIKEILGLQAAVRSLDQKQRAIIMSALGRTRLSPQLNTVGDVRNLSLDELAEVQVRSARYHSHLGKTSAYVVSRILAQD